MISLVRHRLQQIAQADYCPLYIDWSFGRSTDQAVQLRRYASRHHFRRYPLPMRWAIRSLFIALWPLRVLLLTLHNFQHFSGFIEQQHRIPRWRQVYEQIWLAVTHFVMPPDYYHYQFYRSEQRRLVDQYLYLGDSISLLPALNHYHQHPAIDDKEAFAYLCEAAGLPSVPTLAVCKAGAITWQTEVRSEWIDEIFVKPTQGARGEGTMLWQRLATDRYQDAQGMILSWGELGSLLENLSKKKTYLLQPRLRNHLAISALSPGALNTVRIVTGRALTGHIEVIAATFKIARQDQITSTHGLNSAVDLSNGQLGRAYSYYPINTGYDIHPDTGATITGRILPDWSTAIEVAKQAHPQFTGYVFLGWDVALTPQGPVLLEGNSGWDVLTMQKPQQIPLAHTRFAAICMEWINNSH